jgi:D-alanyl-D-alanine carboxypeptidase
MTTSAFGMLLVIVCTGQTPPVNRLAAVVDGAAERAMTVKLAPGVVVLVASHGRVIFLRGYGVLDLKSRRPVTPNTHFEIGSVTKQFTATAIMQLLDAGKLSLDDALSKYVPTYTVGASVTIRQLLWQTSGIPNYVERPDIMKLASTMQPSLQGVLNLIAGKPLRFTPGTQWAYSNTNYFLLAHVIEVASGKTYQQYLRNYIFGHAGMTDTGFVSDEPHFSDMARGYLMSNGAPAPSPAFFGGWAAGAGDIVSTAPDMLKWDNALLAGKIVGLPYVAMMRTSGTLMSSKLTGYGMGWYIDKPKNGVITIWHNGGTFGFSADNNTYSSNDATIIVMDNNIAADAEDVAREIFEGIHL